MADELTPLADTPVEEEITSPGWLFGGVSRLPTLAIVVGACDDCDALTLKDEYLCIGGGGSSKLPKCAAFGLLAAKLEPPIGSGPGCIEAG